jgi:GrpB-like predicted nucleotidyltransferase (UPF0157 family)
MTGTTRIVLSPYDPAWPAVFAREAEKIASALGAGALALHHAGSTSVPGLSAKPIIDIVLAVADSADEAAYVLQLEASGYRFAHREPEWFEHRLMRGADPAVNLHIFTSGCAEIDRMLVFRDWLRARDDERLLYERTKQVLALRMWRSVQDYADAKTEIVSAIMARALATRG